MAHTPKPHGAFQQGGPASEEDAGVAAHLLKRLQAVKTAGDLPSHKMVQDLPGGGKVIAQDMGGVTKTIIIKPEPGQSPVPPELEEIDYGFAQMHIPMLYSGHVVEPKPRIDGGGEPRVRIKLTQAARRRMESYKDDSDKKAPEEINYRRFAIEYHDNHAGFRPEEPGVFFHSQYAELRPTWWSGSMRAVVQVAQGFGKQPKSDDDPEVPPEERDKIVIPEKWYMKIEQELGQRRNPGYTGRPPESGQIAFRFDIQKTHGVGFGSDKKPWLLEVSKDGVYAMPLPVIPMTTTEAFREWMEEVQDAEILHLLDKFGGVPSGEGFPETEELREAWKKAGVVIRLCDTSEFYADGMQTQWFSCGWSFSDSGKEGFNTCYSYGDDGVKVGHAFKLSITLGAYKKEKWTLPDFGELSPEESDALDRYLGELYQALGTGPESLPVKFKLCNVEASEILGRVKNGGAADVEFWKDKECDPIADHSGRMSKVGSGKLYAPGSPIGHPKIQFPVPMKKMGGGINFDFSANRTLEEEEAKKIKCDTIILGYYVGDQLKVVKYFRDPREIEPEHNPYPSDQCMWVGSFESTTTYTPTYMWGHFYTSDFDAREVASENMSRSVLTAWVGGYSKPFVNIIEYLHVWFRINRKRAFHNMTESWSYSNKSKSIAVCVPWSERNAVLHAQYISPGRKEHSVGQFETHELLDTYTYTAGSYMKFFRWIGRNWGKRPVEGDGDGVPFLVDTESKHDLPWNRCVGDSEPYLQEGQDVTHLAPWVLEWGKLSGPSGGPCPPGDFPEAVYEVEEDGEYERPLDYSAKPFTGRALKSWSAPYFAPTPDGMGFATKIPASMNCCGDSEYAMVADRENQDSPYLNWGNSTLLEKGDIPRFIGVIHE